MMMKNYLILLIFIAAFIIGLSFAAPITHEDGDSSSAYTDQPPANAQTSTTYNESPQWWKIVRDFIIQPTFKYISEESNHEIMHSSHSTNSSIDNSNNNNTAATSSTATEAPIEPPKIFSYLDDVVFQIVNLTFLGYIYIGVLVFLIFLLLCCTGCCCCCACCRCH